MNILRLLIICACLAGIVSPIDLIPDALPIIGTLDDSAEGAIVAMLLRAMAKPNKQPLRR